MPNALKTAADLVRIFANKLGENDRQFIGRIYSVDESIYATRTAQCGFMGLSRVLDAGCGFGQWSLALGKSNTHVDAVDTSQTRIAFTQEMATRLTIKTIKTHMAQAQQLPFEDGTFDGVFCYGVLFVTPWRQTLQEFKRVLAPGGKLYINANGFGWYKHLWCTQHNKTKDYDPRYHAAAALMNAWKYDNGLGGPEEGTHILIDPEDLTAELDSLGFRNQQHGAEGTILSPNWSGDPAPPFFQEQYLGDLGVYEIVAEKD